jgi:hypothetical protein
MLLYFALCSCSGRDNQVSEKSGYYTYQAYGFSMKIPIEYSVKSTFEIDYYMYCIHKDSVGCSLAIYAGNHPNVLGFRGINSDSLTQEFKEIYRLDESSDSVKVIDGILGSNQNGIALKYLHYWYRLSNEQDIDLVERILKSIRVRKIN